MKRILGHVVSTVVVAVVAAAAAPGCVTNDQSIFIRSVLAPSTNRQQGSCVYTDDPAQPALFEGRLDVALRDSYRAIILVGNQMVPRGDPAQTRAESNRVHINGAVVRVTSPDGEVFGEFTSTGSGFADPAANNVADYGSAAVVAIDARTKDRIMERNPGGATVVANMKVFGQTLGGVDVESGEFQFPIRVCRGCLVRPDKDLGPCDLEEEASGQQTGVCQYGQDEAVSCQSCRGIAECDNPGL